MGVTRWLTDALFPRHCARCGEEGGTLCRPCDARSVFVPVREAAPEGVPVDGLVCAGPYADPTLRKLIGAWKFSGDAQARDAVLDRVRAAAPAGAFDAVTWVPLHEKRRRARGFDQAEEVARAAASALGIPCVALLRRTARTRQRSLVVHSKRKAGDLDGAFEAADLTHTPSFERRGVASCLPLTKGKHDEVITGARILLCDDVFTSGATMGAAAAALKRAGAGEVHGFAVARG